MAVINEEKYVSIYFEHNISEDSQEELNNKLLEMGINAKLDFEITPDGTKIKIERYPK